MDSSTAMREMRDSGKVRHLGISTTLPYLPTFLDWGVFDTMQIPYSALEREHEDWITKAAEAGVGIIIRGGVAQGEVSSGDRAGTWSQFEQAGLDELREPGESRSAFVLRFTLTHPHAHTIIVGTTRVEHLHENIEAVMRGRWRTTCTPRPSVDSTVSARRRCRRGRVLEGCSQKPQMPFAVSLSNREPPFDKLRARPVPDTG